MDWPILWDTVRNADPHAAAPDLGIDLDPVESGVDHLRARRLYRAGRDAWVLAMPSAPAQGESVPFSLYWAASEAAAVRVACGLPGADDGALGEPPEELLIEPGLLTRSDLQTWVRQHQPRYVEQGFAGFSPLSGAYVRVGQLVYHFRSIRWEPEERPYAIEYDPRPAESLFRKLAAFHYRRR